MADYLEEMSRRGIGDAPHAIRMARYLIDLGLFEENIVGDWPKEPQPASQEAIKSLETFEIQGEGKDCSICLMDFKKKEKVTSLPCHHMFHDICIMTWLNQNSTCPFCRYKLESIQKN